VQFAHGAIFQDGRHQLSGSNISGSVQHCSAGWISWCQAIGFFGSNNPIKIFPGRLDDGKVKIQNGGTKVATDRAFEAYMSQENHRCI